METPIYPWFDQAPGNLRTRRQLAESGLRPGGPIRGRVVWRRGERWADLYDMNEAQPKQAATPAQLAALAKASEARRTCSRCKTVLPFIPSPWADCPVCEKRAREAELAKLRQRARNWLAAPDTIILDTETTDLHGYVVQLAAIDTSGVVLLDTLVNPLAPIAENAQRVHGISAEQVATAPTFAQLAEQVLALLADKQVVTYNASYDRGVLLDELERLIGDDTERRAAYRAQLSGTRWRCAMELYSAWYGDWSEYHQDYRYQPLPGGDHSALGDCRATLAVLQRVASDSTEPAA